MIFYFTATGNSLYVAKQLDPQMISIPQALRDAPQHYEDAAIGIVCPVFGHEMPPMVKDFLRQNTFETPYFYIVLTYGHRHGGAAELARDFCEACNVKPAYIQTIEMVDNFLPAFDMKAEEALERPVDADLDAIKKDIVARRHFIEPATMQDRAHHEFFLSLSDVPPEKRWQDIYRVTGNCVGCGVCAKVCPAGCIAVENGRAVYGAKTQRVCQGCMACIQACPQKAITMTVPEVNPQARYRNPHIQLPEIMKANDQHAAE